ncbi:hypothetical protein CEXT_695881 [Caerostris extrusa]|uniref:Uncharacterized protein n=1 Tax=Caerostris extrusa TaxID=172846 RepID=A0AAV4NIE8_CAEEX|nr:hypothetical protein CEXT_695881 [Caerostris extrusa]
MLSSQSDISGSFAEAFDREISFLVTLMVFMQSGYCLGECGQSTFPRNFVNKSSRRKPYHPPNLTPGGTEETCGIIFASQTHRSFDK